MLLLHLKTASRHLLHNRTNIWINILGLALGLSITLLIWMHVLYEKSYDRFFQDHNRIYRVHNTLTIFSEEPISLPLAMYPFAPRAMDLFPEIQLATRFGAIFPNSLLRLDEKIIHAPMIAAVDSTFFDMFSLKFLAGEPATALTDRGSLVLTESLAARLFENPLLAVHETVNFNDGSFRVTAIIEDLPANSHMTFNALVSIWEVHEGMTESGFGFYTYLKLLPGSDLNSLQKRMSDLSEELVLANPYYQGDTAPVDTRLTRLSDIHLTSNLLWEMKDNGSKRNVQAFSTLSVFILMLALINYMNTATARSSLRAKEIGLRKVAGSSRSSLIRQFMLESFLITLIAFVLALVLAESMAGFFTSNLGLEIHSGFIFSRNGLLTLAGLLLFTGTMAGIYPSFYLSSFNPVNILKGEMVKGKKGQFFRRCLVVFQFAITMFLASSLLVINMQLNFIMNQNLGFDKSRVLVIKDISRNHRRVFPELIQRLEAIQGVTHVSGADFVVGERTAIEVISEMGISNQVKADILTVDEKFLSLMQINLSEGRNFNAHSELDASGAYLLNRAAVKAIGLQDPLNARLSVWQESGPVIGIVEDFRLKSLHNPIEPLLFRYSRRSFPQIYLKLNAGDLSKTRDEIISVLQDLDPVWDTNLTFLEESVERQYEKERQAENLLWAGSLLSIFISLLGVYGLAAFTIERRIKEISIRKILGASNGSILWAFNREFFLLVSLAFIIAAPLAWFSMERWLAQFNLHVNLNPAWFIIPGLITMVLTTLIIFHRVHNVSKASPVESLKVQN